jgi:hypothetical protein
MKGFDQWLTTNPNDQDDSFFEAVTELYTDAFFEAQEGKFIDSDKETDIINKCISKDYSPKTTAKIIQRLHKLYKL